MKKEVLSWIRWSLSKKGFWSRALLCWLFAVILLKFDELDFYDARFKIRGDRPANQDIILITIKPSDFVKFYDLKTNSIVNYNEMQDLSDSFFWDQHLWFNLLQKVLAQDPKSIAVTLFFGENIGSTRLNSQEVATFKNPKIKWATNSSDSEKISYPFATLSNRSNIAYVDVLRDEDGLVRRLPKFSNFIPDIAHSLVNETNMDKVDPISVINYKGLKRYDRIELQKIIRSEIPDDLFKNKFVIIGVEKSINSQILTPLGPMAKHEFWAQVADNILSQQFIRKGPSWFNAILLLILTVLAVLTITHFPQSVSFFVFVWYAAIWSALSVGIFDKFAIWIPLISPIVLLILIWVLYIGYHAVRIEKAHAELQQEQRYLSDLEQLKNNFVSLISHDLKTPIAKIQAVIDRLHTQQNMPSEFNEDFASLKLYSDELNRYIQSILKVLRVESRDFKIMKETADINGVIENVIERLKPLAETKNIDIQLQLEPMFLIEFDVTLMTEVILNLVENAIKYTPQNGHVSIHTTETSTEILIEIKDSGEGISNEDQLHIWKKFVRGRNQDLKTKGTGLGLYLVKYFIELHGGQITLQSKLGEGTVFNIRLPIDPVD